MKFWLSMVFLLVASARAAEHPVVTTLLQKELTDMPGKETLVLSVVYPPGSVEAAHRHAAHAFVYVIEGSVVMQVRGSPAVTLGPGQVFYEGPGDVHTVGRNPSRTKSAKFVVVLVKDKGVDAVLPAN